MEFITIADACSAQGREIVAYANTTTAQKYTYLIAGVHGDEPEGVFIINQLFAWLKQQNILLPLIVIPALNPDGLAAKTRVNGNGVDLNRNWPSKSWCSTCKEERYNPGSAPLSEPENIFLESLFKKYKPSIIFTFHSWKPLLDHNQLAKSAADFIARYTNYPTADYIGYPTPGSLGSYVDEVMQCGILTYELPPTSGEDKLNALWVANARGLQNYFLHFSAG